MSTATKAERFRALKAMADDYGLVEGAPQEHRDRAWETASGYKLRSRSLRNPKCWRRLFGKKHLDHDCGCPHAPTGDFPVGNSWGWPIWDHVRPVRDRAARAALMLEPFWFSAEHAQQLTAWCEARALTWAVCGFGPYSPGRTVAIIVKPKVYENVTIQWRYGDDLPWPRTSGRDR